MSMFCKRKNWPFKPTINYPISTFSPSEFFARIFGKRGCGGIPPPNPLLPPRPSGFWELSQNCVSNFAQNGFALNSEYATIQDKSNFWKRLPRGFAPRHLRVPPCGTRQIATVRKNPFGLSSSGGGGSFQFLTNQ